MMPRKVPDYERSVRPLLHGLLDDRFLIVDFPRRVA